MGLKRYNPVKIRLNPSDPICVRPHLPGTANGFQSRYPSCLHEKSSELRSSASGSEFHEKEVLDFGVWGCPEGLARHLDASRQKLTPHCLAAIFDSQLPSPKLSLKVPPKLPLPHNRGHFFLFRNCPRGEGNCAASERQKLSRGNFCLAASRCLSGPSGGQCSGDIAIAFSRAARAPYPFQWLPTSLAAG